MNPLQWPLWGKAVAVAVVAAAAGLAGTAVALSPGPHHVPVARLAPSSKPQAATSAASPTPASSGLSAGCQMGEGNFSPVTQQNISDDDPSCEVTVVNNTASPVTVNGFSVSMTAYGSQITTDSPTVNPSLMEPGEKWTFNTPITSGVEVSGQTYLNTECTVTLITTDNGDVQPLQMNEPNGEANTHQQNITDAQNQLQNDLGTLNQDVSGMYGDVSKIAGDVSQTDNDLSQTRTDAANGNGDECLNASTTVYNDAATTVYNDVLTTAYNDAGTVGTDIAAIRKQISTIQADQAALLVGAVSGAGLPGLQISLFEHARRLQAGHPGSPLPGDGEPYPDEMWHEQPRPRSPRPYSRAGADADADAVLDGHFARPDAEPAGLEYAFHEVRVPVHWNEHIAAAAWRADPGRVRQTGRWLVAHSRDRCSATIGLALLATGLASDDVPLICTIGLLSDRFGPLAARSLQRRRDTE